MGLVCMGTAASGPQFLQAVFYQFLVFPMRSVALFVIILPPMAITMSLPLANFCVILPVSWASMAGHIFYTLTSWITLRSR